MRFSLWNINTENFISFVDRFVFYILFFSILFLCIGLYCGFSAPPDYQQGFSIRIMYLHVPFAWLSIFCYLCMAFSALGILFWPHPLAQISFKVLLLMGGSSTFITLVTGCLWAKPIWGTWWVWDARLTSFFIVFFMYLGLFLLIRYLENAAKSFHSAAILCLLGIIDIPIIKFSVYWWNTLHQPSSIFRLDGVRIHTSFLVPLFVIAIGFFLFFFFLYLFAMRTQILRLRIASKAFLPTLSEESML